MLWLTLRQLKSSNAIKRVKAAEKLAATPNAQAFEHLVTALTDADFEVRMVSARGLGQFGERAVKPLVSALKDKSSSVREAAVGSLAKISGQQIVMPLMDALEDEDSGVRKAAANVLKKIGASESKQALEEYHRREEEATRLAEEATAKRLAEEEARYRLTCVKCKRKSDKLVIRQGELVDGYAGFGQCPSCQLIWCSNCYVQGFGEADLPDFLKRRLADMTGDTDFGKIGMVTNQCPECKETLRPPRVPQPK